MSTLTARQIAAATALLSLAALTSPWPAAAQQPSDTPPKMEKLEEGAPPEVNIRPPEQRTKIKEKRANGGEVTEVEVQSGKSTYVVKPNQQHGAMPGDGQASNLRAPQWKVKEFDLGRRDQEKDKQAAEEAAAGKLPPAPPPPEKK